MGMKTSNTIINSEVSENLISLINKSKNRCFKVYSCYYCESSGNYIKLLKFDNVKSAGDYYNINELDIEKSINYSLKPVKTGKLSGLSLEVLYDTYSNKTKRISFFKLEDEKVSKAVACYTLEGVFLGYFNNFNSLGKFLGVTESKVRRCLRRKKILETPFNISFKLYVLNLTAQGLPMDMKGNFFKGSIDKPGKDYNVFLGMAKMHNDMFE